MNITELKEKAASLPLLPGVYIMYNSDHQVIYVGKAKKLRNRVSQYFQDTVSHSPKTKMMVSKVHTFDVIIASSEFEALVLECAQIKRYLPKYNILLKDDKGFPYIRLDMKQAFPTMKIANTVADDGALYFGPYGSRGITQKLIDTIHETLMLPLCSKQFPRDLGKGRVCLNYHMGKCYGWCQKQDPLEEYQTRMLQAKQILTGDFRELTDSIKAQMLTAAEDLNFELAASLRDRLKAIQALNHKQFVTAMQNTDIDAIGYGETESKACFAVLHFSGGELVDKEYEIVTPGDKETSVSSLVKQYYLNRGYAPKTILLPFAIEDADLFQELLQQQYSRKISIKVPQRGDNLRLIEMSCNNARQEAERITDRESRHHAVLDAFAKMLAIEQPHRIESFDISNISGKDNVASMVVFTDGKPRKSEYKRFKVDLGGFQDDYSSMRQVLTRRLQNYTEAEKGFSELADIWLIDGGVAHAQIAESVKNQFQVPIAVFGMVKDDRHRTRALVTPDGKEIAIDSNPAVFSFVGSIQEETHRFAVTYHRKLRSKRLRYSELDNIEGIGPKRKQLLLKHFSSIAAIKDASVTELEHYLPKNAALAVYRHFHHEEG